MNSFIKTFIFNNLSLKNYDFSLLICRNLKLLPKTKQMVYLPFGLIEREGLINETQLIF